jgi:alkylation response protein AidB-like acyl-CoA dehydrogenase
LILAMDEGSGELFTLKSVDPMAGIDPGSRLAKVVKGASVARVEERHILNRARVLVAAEQLGIIEAVRDMSAAYAQTRTQFGKPIGAFQAVKHRCADMAVAAYATIGEVFQAALLVEAGTEDATFHAATAYVLATNGAKVSTADNIQNHGGMGFTWEQDSHLFLKRALLLEHILGEQRKAYEAILAPRRHEFT